MGFLLAVVLITIGLIVLVSLIRRTSAWGGTSRDFVAQPTTEGGWQMQVVTKSPGIIKVIREYERGVVFRFGKLKKVLDPGLHILIPISDRMMKVSLRTVTMPVPSQSIITKDNVSIDIAAVAYYHVRDPMRAVVAIEDVGEAINQIAQTTVRNVVGQSTLDDLLQNTEHINVKIKDMIDAQTEPWGIVVSVVEVKDVTLPENLKRAMAKEAEAEREKRAKIIAADGEFVASQKLSEAAYVLSRVPVAVQLRTLQTLAEISIEKNSTIIFPVELITGMTSLFVKPGGPAAEPKREQSGGPHGQIPPSTLG